VSDNDEALLRARLTPPRLVAPEFARVWAAARGRIARRKVRRRRVALAAGLLAPACLVALLWLRPQPVDAPGPAPALVAAPSLRLDVACPFDGLLELPLAPPAPLDGLERAPLGDVTRPDPIFETERSWP
jgi:hypothetical protein